MPTPAFSRLLAKLFVRPSRRNRRRDERLGRDILLEARDVPAVSFTVETVSHAAEGGSPGVFRVTATGDPGDFTPSGVTAIVLGIYGPNLSDTDYTASPAPPSYLSFPSPGSQATITITPVDDTAVEGDETVWVLVQQFQMYPTGPTYRGTMTLHDNDTPVPPPVVTAARVDDAVEGSTPGTFRFSRTGDTTNALTATYTVQTVGPGLATPGTDYAALSGSVTFPAGEATVDVSVVASQDGTTEQPESVILTVTGGSTYAAGPGSAQLWVWDDSSVLPSQVTVTGIADAVEGGAIGYLRFARTGDTGAALAVTYTIASGTGQATPGNDYTALSGTLTFPVGEAFVDIAVTAAADGVAEETEYVTAAVLTGPDYEVGQPDTGVVRIADTDTHSGTIGGFVWDDTNEDGLRDAGEPGRADQPVTLLDADGLPVFTLLTGADGTYAFRGLPEGAYAVQFSQPLLENFTTQDQGTDDAIDSDANPATGMSDVITLTAQANSFLLFGAGFVIQRPPEVNGITVIITDRRATQPEWVKIAKWEGAFEPGPIDPTFPQLTGPTRRGSTSSTAMSIGSTSACTTRLGGPTCSPRTSRRVSRRAR